MSDRRKISRFVLSVGLLCAFCALYGPPVAGADPVGPPKWPQPGGPGSDVFVTYSYSDLLDGNFLLLDTAHLRTATEEAFAVWASVAPIHFIERADARTAALGCAICVRRSSPDPDRPSSDG